MGSMSEETKTIQHPSIIGPKGTAQIFVEDHLDLDYSTKFAEGDGSMFLGKPARLASDLHKIGLTSHMVQAIREILAATQDIMVMYEEGSG